MRSIHLLSILFLGLIITQCTNSGPKTIERPVYGLQNTKTLEIDKIVLTDTATILYIDAYYQPQQWIRIDSATYIQAAGEKYIITGSDNIELNEKHWMPESGESHFTLFFPPIPKGTKSIDFIESDCDDCFKIWDIDLTGKAKAYKADFPPFILNYKVDYSHVLREPVFKHGKTKVTLYLTGLKEGYVMEEPKIMVMNLLSQEREEVVGNKDAEGRYTFVIDLFSTSQGYLVCNNTYNQILLNPGEGMEVYYDVTAYSKRHSRYNPQPEIVYCGFSGGLSELNTGILNYKDSLAAYNTKLYSYSNAANYDILDMDGQQYLDYVFRLYNEEMEKVDGSDFPAAMKQIAKSNLMSSLVNNISMKHRIYDLCYRKKHNLDWNKPADVVFPKADENDFLALKKVNLNDPMWVYADEFGYAVSNLIYAKPASLSLKEITGSESGLLQDMEKTTSIIKKGISLKELTPDDEKTLAEASSPYYREVYNILYQNTKKEQEAVLAKGGFTIEPTPAVASDKILESIVAQYKGHVVFVDFWATWCGPCINAMKTIKPIKPEMKEKGVVSIYISGETSPKGKWMTMLPEIGGLHYYLTSEQWSAVCKKYKINGIPTYMIFDKNGKQAFATAGYPGNDKIKAELSKIW